MWSNVHVTIKKKVQSHRFLRTSSNVLWTSSQFGLKKRCRSHNIKKEREWLSWELVASNYAALTAKMMMIWAKSSQLSKRIASCIHYAIYPNALCIFLCPLIIITSRRVCACARFRPRSFWTCLHITLETSSSSMKPCHHHHIFLWAGHYYLGPSLFSPWGQRSKQQQGWLNAFWIERECLTRGWRLLTQRGYYRTKRETIDFHWLTCQWAGRWESWRWWWLPKIVNTVNGSSMLALFLSLCWASSHTLKGNRTHHFCA